MTKRIAIVGGGPKAAAICAKAATLQRLDVSAPEVVVFEKSAIGSAWTGDAGYTDGISKLCTPIVRDLGFPYTASAMGANVPKVMLASYSWQAFLIEQESDAYARWINQGSQRPPHQKFAQYLEWAIERSGAEVRLRTVSRLAFSFGKWTVHTQEGGAETDFDGVVITGSGPPHRPLRGHTDRVFDGLDFWNRTDEVRALIDSDPEDGVVIIGAGGTAASVASWLIRQRLGRLPITIVGKSATLFTRSAGFFEDRFFGDDDAWGALDSSTRQELIRRLTQGVVWQDVIGLLSEVDDLQYIPGSASEFIINQGDTLLRMTRLDGSFDDLPGAVFVDCRGFSSWWFQDLFDPLDSATPVLQSGSASLAASIGEDLTLGSPFPYPNLHVPMNASMIGPAAANLMALGWMADRVLRPYLDDLELLRLMGIGIGDA